MAVDMKLVYERVRKQMKIERKRKEESARNTKMETREREGSK